MSELFPTSEKVMLGGREVELFPYTLRMRAEAEAKVRSDCKESGMTVEEWAESAAGVAFALWQRTRGALTLDQVLDIPIADVLAYLGGGKREGADTDGHGRAQTDTDPTAGAERPAT